MENNPREPAVRPTEPADPQDKQGVLKIPFTSKYIKFSNKNKDKRYSTPQADKTIDATSTNTKCNCPTCLDSRYEKFNRVEEDSIYSPPFEELKGGKIYVSLNTISDTEKEELRRRFGPWVNNNEYE